MADASLVASGPGYPGASIDIFFTLSGAKHTLKGEMRMRIKSAAAKPRFFLGGKP